MHNTILKFITVVLFVSGSYAQQQREFIFLPVEGKLIGIWTGGGIGDSFEEVKELRKKWGFTGYSIFDDFVSDTASVQIEWITAFDDDLNEQLYRNENIIKHITPKHRYKELIDEFDAGFYYIDEPLEQGGYNVNELLVRASYIDTVKPNSFFVISSYRSVRNDDFENTSKSYPNMHFMYSAYTNWERFFGIWLPTEADQRQSWTDMRNRFGKRFSMSWVDGRGDEYEPLLQHAATLKLNGVWLYCGSGGQMKYVEEFCEAAAKKGWLKKLYAPEKVNLLLPADNETLDTNSVLFQWEIQDSSDTYFFQVSEDSLFVQLASEDTVNGASEIVKEFNLGNKYYWRIKAKNAAGESEWSDVWTFRLAEDDIQAPSQLQPFNNSRNISPKTEFLWKAAENADSYLFQLGDTINFFSPLIENVVTDTFFIVDSLREGCKYFWQIKAMRGNSESLFSDQWGFTTLIYAPSNLTAFLDSGVITLEWINNSDALPKIILEKSEEDSVNFFVIDSLNADASYYNDSVNANFSGLVYYRVKSYNENAESGYSNKAVVEITTGADAESKPLVEFVLFQNFPNPFNSSTKIRFHIPADDKKESRSENVHTKLTVYDILGREIWVAFDERKAPGIYEIEFNAAGIASGIYLYKLKSGIFTDVKKFILLE